MKRSIAASAAIATLLITPEVAMAGDFADRALLGFSPDGAYFAFEEFGVQDGSGSAYSNTYVVDVDKDAWANGSPIRVLREDEAIPLETVRADAHKQAKPLLDGYAIRAAGRAVVSNPSSEVSSDPYKVRFLTDLYANWTTHVWTLTLAPLPFPDPAGCENLGPVHGFRLVLTNPAGSEERLHEDRAMPASRRCAQDYAINDVVTYFPKEAAPVMVVLLNTISQGFEGPDRRFMAVATRFENH
jgi:predicted secreted protein